MSTNATKACPTVKKEITTYLQSLIKCVVDTRLSDFEYEYQYLDAFELPPASDPECHRVTYHRASDLKWVQGRQPKISQQIHHIVDEIRRAEREVESNLEDLVDSMEQEDIRDESAEGSKKQE